MVAGQVEPVTVAEAKSWSAIDTSLDDTILDGIITSARILCENYMANDTVPQTYEYYQPSPVLEDDGYYYVELPRNADTITSIEDKDGAFALADYEFVGVEQRVIKLVNGYNEFVKVVFNSVALASAEDLKLAKVGIRMVAEQIYDNRANLEGDEDIQVIDSNAKRTLYPLKYWTF